MITHGEESICSRWMDILGGLGNIHWVHDPDRVIYGEFGVGYSNSSHFLGGKSLLGVAKLMLRGIRNRKASGTRWQKAATFIINSQGELLWKHEPVTANEVLEAKWLIDNLNMLNTKQPLEI